MNHDFFAIDADADDRDTVGTLILLGTGDAPRVEMTRANHTQLERELAGTLGDPFAALMAQVTIELNEMAASPKSRDIQPA